MKRILIFLLAATAAFGAETDVTILQRDSSNRNQEITITGSSNALKPLGFNASGVLIPMTSATFSATTSLLLGTAGSAVGNIGFRNATSGTATLAPPTGALGTYTVTLPNAPSTLPIFGQQITFAGPTAARTITLPDAAFTVARTDAANTFTGTQAFGAITTTSITNSGLTITRIPFASTGGLLADEAAFTYDPATNTFTADNIVAAVSFSGPSPLSVNNGATGSGVIRILEDTDDGSNYASFQVPALAANTVYTLPADDGDADQILATNGSGTLDWVTPGAGSVLWNSVGDPDGNNSISQAGHTSIFLSTLDDGILWELSDTDADASAATTLLKLSHNDGADADVDYLVMTGDKDGTPTTDFRFNQSTGFTSLLPINPPSEAFDPTGWNSDTGAPQKDAVRDEMVLKANLSGGNTLSGAQTLAESATVRLDSALSADGTYTGTEMPGTAGATLAFGDIIVLDVTDSRWELADANSAAAADGDARGLIGICVLAAASDGDPTMILLSGTIRADAVFPSFTVTAPVYVSETAGDATSTSPTTEDNVVRVLGYAITADSIYFNPAGSYITYDAP